MSIIYLDPKDVEILELLVTLVHISSYRLSKISGMAPSTVWRTMVKLKTLGLITKDGRQFSITPRGLVIAYYTSKKQFIRISALENLKEAWKYDGSTEELRNFLDSLKSFLDEHQISPMSVCFNQPLSVVILMLPRASQLKEESKNVLVRFILKSFPSIVLPKGCRAVLSFDEKGEPYALAADCGEEGIHLFHKCSVINSFVRTEVKAKK